MEILEMLSDANFAKFLTDYSLLIVLGLGVLKVIAKATPWAADDEILQIFTNFFNKTKS